MSYFSGPTPPYNNPPIHPEYFEPSMFFISDVDLGRTTIVTTTENNNYVIGQLVRLIIPKTFGCVQLNEVSGYVLSIPSPDQVELAIDSSRNVNEYVSSSANTQAQILAIGDTNSGIISSTGRNIPTTNIPGSFINISP
jgi:CO/xanthine dehydrogenase Mo-binding subunit